MYVSPNFKTKKAFKDAIASGRDVSFYHPAGMGPNAPQDGTVFVEGPHYPEPHRWYAKVTIAAGRVTKIS